MDNEASEAAPRYFRRREVLAVSVGRTRIALIAAVALGLASALVPAACAAAPELYVAEGPGLVVTFKAEGRHVYITTLAYGSSCTGVGAHAGEVGELVGEDFLEGPEELKRSGHRLTYGEGPNEVFSDQERLVATLRPDAIVGTFSASSGGDVEGEGSCSTGSPGGGGHIHFKARRYVPFDNASAAAPMPGAPAFYFVAENPLELYFWIDAEAVTAMRGTAVRQCVHRGRRSRNREGFLRLGLPPFPLSSDGSFSAWGGYRERSSSDSTRLSGNVGEGALNGRISEVETARRGGKVIGRCHTGPRRDGVIPFRAARWVPAG
jgi:hypothetical protein